MIYIFKEMKNSYHTVLSCTCFNIINIAK